MIFFYQGFLSETLIIHRIARKGRAPSFIPLYHFPPFKNIETFVCKFACETTITYFQSQCLCIPEYYSMRFNTLSNYYLIDWLIYWCNVPLFISWIDSRVLLQWFDKPNRWIWTRIDYHPCITNEPTNQVC